jgi:hypothetical protein
VVSGVYVDTLGGLPGSFSEGVRLSITLLLLSAFIADTVGVLPLNSPIHTQPLPVPSPLSLSVFFFFGGTRV